MPHYLNVCVNVLIMEEESIKEISMSVIGVDLLPFESLKIYDL